MLSELSEIYKQNLPHPFLKWAGGKSRLIQQYSTYLPSFKNYYEPFLGGGAVFFYLHARQLTKTVLTDINEELITTYLCVRDHVDDLISLLKDHECQHSKDYYYRIRGTTESSELKKAARLIYLNKTCFNGLYRENSKGEFNVPMGRYKKPNICDPHSLHLASMALKSAEIKVRSFEEVLNYASNKEDFVYFDPPYYPVSATSNFTSYSRYNFDENQQNKLRDVFVELAERGVKVMLSNSDTLFIRNLYKDFNIHTISAGRAINSNAKRRGKVNELLIKSY
ncbi:DNA adenine methylase [Brasilonema sp. UFV-L1]|uniref:DNA adenine methylase n=1 Tax=Brasilonema sp. UFV-L1 TaxID=2234130 RepID=UPI00145F18FC|nr:DNA adenine methylase [Brasilonema sp. UFV-L1]NMG10154.1 DNA adenine methylase [Brasilonema sp. UFV-L1]